ncbi:hypothetical protein CO051_00005, partial [Candidatus Roizmanbacteria bacterium CG_4_9_14_0_2_um_filter_39_13]
MDTQPPSQYSRRDFLRKSADLAKGAVAFSFIPITNAGPTQTAGEASASTLGAPTASEPVQTAPPVGAQEARETNEPFQGEPWIDIRDIATSSRERMNFSGVLSPYKVAYYDDAPSHKYSTSENPAWNDWAERYKRFYEIASPHFGSLPTPDIFPLYAKGVLDYQDGTPGELSETEYGEYWAGGAMNNIYRLWITEQKRFPINGVHYTPDPHCISEAVSVLSPLGSSYPPFDLERDPKAKTFITDLFRKNLEGRILSQHYPQYEGDVSKPLEIERDMAQGIIMDQRKQIRNLVIEVLGKQYPQNKMNLDPVEVIFYSLDSAEADIQSQNPDALIHYKPMSAHGGGYADWPHVSQFVFVNIATLDPYDIVQSTLHECAHRLPTPKIRGGNDDARNSYWGFISTHAEEGNHFPTMNNPVPRAQGIKD